MSASTPRTARTAVVAAFWVLQPVVATALLAGAAALPGTALAMPHVPWLVLALLCAGTQGSSLNIQVRRESRLIFVTEIPLVLGLLHCSPATIVSARAVGAFVACVVFHRQWGRPAKLTFNVVLAAAEAAVAVAVYRLGMWGASGAQPRAWLFAAVAGVAASLYTGAIVTLLVDVLEGCASVARVREALRSNLPQSAAVSTVGVVVATSYAAGPWAVVPLALTTGVLLVANRSHAAMVERNRDLERLYRFSQVVTSHTEMDDILRGLLEQARDLLHAEQARISLLSPDLALPGTELVLTGDGLVRHEAPLYLRPEDPGPMAPVLSAGEAVLVRRGSRAAGHRRWLDRCGLRESIAVPLRGDAGVIAVLAVDDRLGDNRGFDEDDVRLLQTVVNQASTVLRNGHLVDRLRYESLHDGLTGLPNRAYLDRELDRMLADADSPFFTVGFLDLDSFKDVNDTLGHHHGDELLRVVARRLTEAVGGGALIARMGGDEFGVLARDCVDAEDAMTLGRRLLDSLSDPVTIADIEVQVSGSLGLALSPAHGSTHTQLLKCADMAMYAAKSLDQGIVVFDPDLDTTAPTKLALATRLRQAVLAGQLNIHLQPKADLATGAVHSAEALVRWTDAERGAVPPDEFVPLAERSGLIGQLTDLVLDRSIAACAGWQPVAPGVGVAVNLSARSLIDGGLPEQVHDLLREHGLPAELLTLEITESSIMADPARTLGLLHQLRALGVKLSVDDFGTGYSSLSYLRRLPVTEVKVDRSFVIRMAADTEDAAIVQSIIELGHNLGLLVVAEGIEDARTWTRLADHGCHLGQGYHIAPPMPADAFTGWLARYDARRARPLQVVREAAGATR